MRRLRYISAGISALIVFCFLLGCHTQGNVVTKTSAFPKVIEKAKKDQRYFILHSGVDTLGITSIQVENRKEFTVHLDKMDSLRTVTLNNPTVLSKKQLHLFMNDSTSYTLDEPHTIAFSKVARMEFVE
jgi:hypothetical protein